MKKVIVFGATGNTGAYFTEYLAEHLDSAEYEVIAVGRRKTDYFANRGIAYYAVDIEAAEDFDKLPQEDIYCVAFLAGILPAYMKGYHPERYILTNSLGALHVLEYCRKTGAEKIIYTQTISDILGNVKENPLIKPYDKRNIIMKGDHTVYALSKCFAVDLIFHYQAEYGIKPYIFRLPTIYAYTPDEYYYVDGEKRMLGYRILMNKAMNGEPIEMWGDPKRAKDIVYVGDFCQMLYLAVISGNDGGIYNVGTGIATTLEEQLKGLVEVFSPKEHRSVIIPRPDMPDAPAYLMDISNAVEELGYQPAFSYMDYLRAFKEEMRLNRFAGLRESETRG